jgi:hypothetical protein
MKIKPVLLLFLILAGLGLQMPVAASPARQQVAYPSPTPGPDGRIIYKVKAGDTCIEISLLYGVPVEYIRTTNLLDENCTLREGQNLMIGVGVAPSPSPTLNPAEAGGTPTPTPEAAGTARVCVLVYEDVNGDALRQSTENAIAGAAISLTSQDGNYSKTLTSVINPDATAYPGVCFENLLRGVYSISAATPDGYNPTIKMTASAQLTPGDVAYVSFGAQRKTLPAPAELPGTPAKSTPTSPLLGIAGAGLLLVGFGLAAYTWSVLRKK